MGIPTPRAVQRKPYIQFWPSIAWSTLELTINADGTARRGLLGASPFPRHWVYDDHGWLVLSPVWSTFGRGPTSRSAIARRGVLRLPCVRHRRRVGARAGAVDDDHARRRQAEAPALEVGAALATQGEKATDVFLILDGMFVVEVDGREVAEIGPGAIVGERAALEGGVRTATLRAATRARVAEVPAGRARHGRPGRARCDPPARGRRFRAGGLEYR